MTRDLSTSEVASLLGLTVNQIYHGARKGYFPHDTTPGGHRRYDVEEVRAACLGVRLNSAWHLKPERPCSRCGAVKAREEFYESNPSRCKECVKEASAESARLNPRRRKEVEAASRKRNSDKRASSRQDRLGTPADPRLTKYGISVEEWEGLTLKYGSACGICMQQAKLSIDHDHATGSVRGLLCNQCNLGLGNFRDDLVRLGAAMEYLSEFRSR